jgi:hypothetical protein
MWRGLFLMILATTAQAEPAAKERPAGPITRPEPHAAQPAPPVSQPSTSAPVVPDAMADGVQPLAPPSAMASPLLTKEMVWLPGDGLAGVPFGSFPQGGTIRSITCRVEVPSGMTASFYVIRAAPGTAIARGTQISQACNGNGAVAVNQSLLPAIVAVHAGDAIGVTAAGWAGSKGVGTLTVGYSVP